MLYGVVDTARQRGLYELVRSTSDHACLFAGELKPPLEKVSPYLVNLSTAPAFASIWRHHWGEFWGILCESPASFSVLRQHFRKFLQVKLPSGEIALFRFYDPRVFRTYLPTCPPRYIVAWFDGVDEFRMVAEDQRVVLTFTANHEGRLNQTERAWQGADPLPRTA